MFRPIFTLTLIICISLSIQGQEEVCYAPTPSSVLIASTAAIDPKLEDYFKYNPVLDYKVDSVFNLLTEQERVAQMIITAAGKGGKDDATVRRLIKEDFAGGVILMKGKKTEHHSRVSSFSRLTQSEGNLPLLYSMDAEPSLIKGRNQGGPDLGDTYKIKTPAACDSITRLINKELKHLDIRHNYAPVLDISIDNAAIKKRSFGSDPQHVIEMCKQFVSSSQSEGIMATAKHFPGHGLVSGDTHKQSVYIDGKLQELQNYPPLIDHGVLSIMVAHIVIKNNEQYNTDGLPASLSPVIITKLLRKELGFNGLIITDALGGMSAVAKYNKSALMASQAGSDLILMPDNVEYSVQLILDAMLKDLSYRHQVYDSVKRIIRAKFCLGLLH